MALEWLKDILGEKHSPEIEAKIEKAIGKDFVSRKDFNTTNNQLRDLQGSHQDVSTLQAQLDSANQTILGLNQEIANKQKDYLIDLALQKAGAVDLTAVRAVMSLDDLTIKDGKISGLAERIEQTKKEKSWAFANQNSEMSKAVQLPLANTSGSRGGTPPAEPPKNAKQKMNELIRGKESE